MRFYTQKDGYAIISAILIIGFLLILTVGGFQLVLQEVYDGRGKQNYLKAYAAAEAGLELALYEVRDKGYGYFEDRPFSSDIFGDGPRNAQFAYELLGRVDSHSGGVEPSQIDIIPLFWIDANGVVHRVSGGLEFESNPEIAWNIVGENVGVGGSGNFESASQQVNRKQLEEAGNFNMTSSTLDAFLATPEEKYLFIINTGTTPQDYTLTSSDSFFTLPRHDIISSGRVGNFTQNIRTHLDNTEFLGLLRYSIFAGD